MSQKELQSGPSPLTYGNIQLTERESEVLRWLARGYTDHEIGKKLFLSHFTVNSYRKTLLKKFNARNSCHLVYLNTKNWILNKQL